MARESDAGALAVDFHDSNARSELRSDESIRFFVTHVIPKDVIEPIDRECCEQRPRSKKKKLGELSLRCSEGYSVVGSNV